MKKLIYALAVLVTATTSLFAQDFVDARETECAGAAFGSLKINHRLNM